MRVRDELIVSFRKGLPERVAQATELWLGIEAEKQQNMPVLRRLLHTLKGEAHMLELLHVSEFAELCESVIHALSKAGQATPLTGDALLGGFEGLGLVGLSPIVEEPEELAPLKDELRRALAELEAMAGEKARAADEGDTHHAAGRGVAVAVSAAGPANETAPGETTLTFGEVAAGQAPESPTAVLAADDVKPLVYDLMRVHAEQGALQLHLREAQRMLRALLAEIDPKAPPGRLAARITKTLGYGAEVDRRLTAIRAEWSSSDFSIGTSLEELERKVRRASVVGTERLFQQVVRVARSTARTLGKDVGVSVRGGALVDVAIERCLEPALLHLVRNAVDHGIELAELRLARGKPARGQVEVSVQQTESAVIVDVSDDGGGVDFQRLRAVLRGRVQGVDELPDDELVPYLLEPGVTTSNQVTHISGRGVGLDVVAREISMVGGHTRIESKAGEGTRITMSLPATLRGEVALPIQIGECRYAIPTRAVHSVIRIYELEQGADGHFMRVQIEGKPRMIRVFSLSALLGDDSSPRVGQSALVLCHEVGAYAVSVEGYDNPRPIALQNTQQLLYCSHLVRGVAPTPDGGVLVLLDVDALHAVARAGAGVPGSSRDGAGVQPRVLVVEDAPVARELLSGIVRSLGFKVLEATDGRQGLALARSSSPHLILTDVEMPYLDGIEMVTELRRSPGFERVPVVVLTTATDENNLVRLEHLGVEAVLSKQRFVESDLRRTIQRCLRPGFAARAQ